MIKKKNNIRFQKGITLIALVISILVIIILAGVSISSILLGENSLFEKITQAEVEGKKAQYFEDIEFEIYNEYIERLDNAKEEQFILSIKNRLEQNLSSWVSSVNEIENNVLEVETKDNYEIIIDIDNINQSATIRKDSFEKIENEKIYTISFNSNCDYINAPNEIQKTSGVDVILPEISSTRYTYIFDGWGKLNTSTIAEYTAGSQYSEEGNKTLYAVWTPNYQSSVYVSGLNPTIGNVYTVNIIGSNAGTVWGDEIYTDDSNIAKAAVHARTSSNK